MINEKEYKEKIYKRITVVLTILCTIIITVIGTVMLKIETKSAPTISKHENSPEIEQTIDTINSTETKKTKYNYQVHGLININTADKTTLMTLEGIGETKAEAIISYRTSKQFTSVSEITNIKGIGEKTYEKIKDKICVK